MRSTRIMARSAWSSVSFTCSTVLHLTCSIFSPAGEKIGATRFELATSRSRTVRSIQAELRPVNA